MSPEITETITGRAREILEAPNYIVLSIPRANGTVQSNVVWADLDGENILLNSAIGRHWPANLQKAKHATILAMADNNPYEWVSVEGELISATTDDAIEEIDGLAKKYLGVDTYPNHRPDEQRISFRLRPLRVKYVKQG
jgi:PPOX class probable F420-dependent enzyme